MSRKKDVLFLCQFFYPEYISSATLPYDTAKALAKSGLEVGVLCGYPKEYSTVTKVPLKEEYEGIDIHRLKYLQLKRSNIFGRLVNYFSFTFSVLCNFVKLKNYKSIIVYSNPPVLPLVAALANKFFGTKVVFVSYDVYPEIAVKTNSIGENSLISKVMKFANNLVYENVSQVVALSNDMKRFLLKNRKQINENQITVIPNWFEDKPKIDKTESYNNELFEQARPKEKLVVSYFGNMGIAQDLNTLVEAIKVLRDDSEIVFLFAGHGNKVSVLKNTVREETLNNVHIFEFLHGKDFQDALNISDVFIVSLENGVTGLAVPSKTYSYMMAGKPIIAVMDKEADIPQNLLNHEAGYGVNVGDVTSLVSAIRELKEDENKRIETGKNARKLFKNQYTTEKGTSQYIEMMRKIMEDEKCLETKLY